MPVVPKRILMTVDAVGGIWSYALELARALDKHDVQIVIATMGPPPSRAQSFEAMGIRNVELFESKFKLEWMENPWDDLRAAGEWLLKLESTFHPDVVHLNGYTHAALPWRTPKLVVGHSCLYSWWRAVRGGDPPPEWKAYKAAVQRGLDAAGLVVAPTRAMLNALNDNYPSSARRRSLVIPNGLNTAHFRPTLKQKFVLAAGRLWDEAKNIESLMGIASQLPWAVCLAGEQQDLAGGTALQMRPNCYGLGQLPAENLRYWYSCASIYVLPARYEPFGLTVLEAALSGCALVLGSIDSLKENWEGAAQFVRPDDRPGLTKTVLKLIKDETCRRRLGQAARERGLTFDSSRMGQLYFDAYRDLLANRRGKEMAVCA